MVLHDNLSKTISDKFSKFDRGDIQQTSIHTSFLIEFFFKYDSKFTLNKGNPKLKGQMPKFCKIDIYFL